MCGIICEKDIGPETRGIKMAEKTIIKTEEAAAIELEKERRAPCAQTRRARSAEKAQGH